MSFSVLFMTAVAFDNYFPIKHSCSYSILTYEENTDCRNADSRSVISVI